MHKFAGVGLEVYEEETDNVFEDRSDEILKHSTTARLLSFPNVMITSHQGFFTKEALTAIASTTLQNALDFASGKESANDVKQVICAQQLCLSDVELSGTLAAHNILNPYTFFYQNEANDAFDNVKHLTANV